VALTHINANGTLFANYMQSDGVIDANGEQVKMLQEYGVVPYKPGRILSENQLQGIDNQLFNTLFSTNGFVIMTTADDVDQIYYYEVNPVQGYAAPQAIFIVPPTAPPTALPTAPQPSAGRGAVYYASAVTNYVPPLNCRGYVGGKEQRVDYVQEKMVLYCFDCPNGW
jgi:hypothetical protein